VIVPTGRAIIVIFNLAHFGLCGQFEKSPTLSDIPEKDHRWSLRRENFKI